MQSAAEVAGEVDSDVTCDLNAAHLRAASCRRVWRAFRHRRDTGVWLGARHRGAQFALCGSGVPTAAPQSPRRAVAAENR